MYRLIILYIIWESHPRLTELGAEILQHAIRGAELSEAIESIVSNRLSDVSGTLRLYAPPSISDTLLTPLVTAFQASYPNVRIQILVTDRFVDHIVEGMDVVDRISVSPTGPMGPFKSDAPLQPVVIQNIELLAADPAPAGASAPASAPPAAAPPAGASESTPPASPAAPPTPPPVPPTSPTEGNPAQPKQPRQP